MAISEATALSRAVATRKAFPKGKITESQARAMFVAMADSQVGYRSGNPSWSMYGKPKNWRSNWGGRQVYWCALFGAWVADFAFGPEAARAGFGIQSTAWGWPPVGGTWTVWVLNWARANGRIVSFDQQQSGDISLQRYGRTGAEVDHYEIVRSGRSLNLSNTIGGNTSPGNASAGAGVYRAARSRGVTKFIIRPDWAALVKVYNANIIEESDELSAAEVKEIKDHIDVLRRERTNAHTKELANQEAILARLAVIEAAQAEHTRQNNTIGRVAAEARDNQPTVEEIVKGVYTDNAQGLSRDWWSRLGLVLDEGHRQYPADPGSLADFIIRTFEQVTGEVAEVYDGTQKRPIKSEPHGAASAAVEEQ